MGRKSPLVKIPGRTDLSEDLEPWPGDDVYKGKRNDIMRSQDLMIIAALKNRNMSFSQITRWYERELNRGMNNPTIRAVIKEIRNQYVEEANRSYEELMGQQLHILRQDLSEARANYELARDDYEAQILRTKRRTVIVEDDGTLAREREEEVYEAVDSGLMKYWWEQVQKLNESVNEILGLQKRKAGSSINIIGQQNVAQQTNHQKAYISIDPDKWDGIQPTNNAHGLDLLEDGAYDDIIEGEYSNVPVREAV